MRILFVSHSFEMGGVEKLVADLSRELQKRGHETRRIALFVKGSLYDKGDSKCIAPLIFDVGFIRKIKLLFYPLFFLISPVILWRLRKEVLSFKPDVLHLNMWGADIFGSVIGKSLRIRMVSTQHDEVRIGFVLRTLKAKALKKMDVVVAISEAVESFLTSYFDVPKNKIRRIYNSVNLDKFKRLRKPDVEWGPVVGSVGRLTKIKGHIFILEAVNLLKKQGLEIPKIFLVGGGAEEEVLKNFIEINKLKNVVITGEVSDISGYLKEMDVFILPSISEGLGIVLIEALAAGKLIIASDVGGVGEIVEDGKTGILVPPANPDALADKLKGVLLRKEEWLSFRRNAVELADRGILKKFDFQEMVSAYEEVYKA